MKRIEFKNLPDKTTPISADNLNQLQDNVSEAILNPVVESIECKNLFDINGTRIDKNSIISTILGNAISTKCDGSWSYLDYYNIKLVKGKTYTISFDFINSSNNAAALVVLSVVGTVLGSVNFTDSSGSKSFTFTADDSVINVRLCPNNTENVSINTVIYSNIQIEEGTTVTEYTSYKKYGYNSQESMGSIVVDDIRSKNLLNSLNDIKNDDSKFSYVNNNGNFIFTAITSDNRGSFPTYFEINCEKNQNYYLSWNVLSVSTNSIKFNMYIYGTSISGELIAYSTDTEIGREGLSFNSGSYEKIIVSLYLTGSYISGNTVSIKDIQLEKGIIATNYSEYKGISYTSGSNENGSWVKYDDGRMDCYRRFAITKDINNSFVLYGGTAYYAQLEDFDFPQKFKTLDYSSVSVESSSNAYALTTMTTNYAATLEKTQRLLVISPDQDLNDTIIINICARGYWK